MPTDIIPPDDQRIKVTLFFWHNEIVISNASKMTPWLATALENYYNEGGFTEEFAAVIVAIARDQTCAMRRRPTNDQIHEITQMIVDQVFAFKIVLDQFATHAILTNRHPRYRIISMFGMPMMPRRAVNIFENTAIWRRGC
jgi:hypothetical protein